MFLLTRMMMLIWLEIWMVIYLVPANQKDYVRCGSCKSIVEESLEDVDSSFDISTMGESIESIGPCSCEGIIA